MLKYIVRRLVASIPTIIGVVVIVFSLMYFSPYDPALEMGHQYHLNAEQIENLRQEMGLDAPYFIQLGRWFLNLGRADLGISYVQRLPVGEMLRSRLWATAELAVAGMLLATVFGIALGALAALRENSVWDTLSIVLALVGSAMPDFWLAMMMIFLFSLTLRWLPTLGQGDIRHLIMPAIVVGFTEMGVIARTMRSSLIEVMHEDYVRTARAKGLKEWAVVLRHAMRNAFIPTVTIIGINLGAVLGGVVIVETVFAREGIGRLVVQSILFADTPVLQGVVLLSALVFIFVNLAVDLMYAILDPRISYSERR
jgi:peptide/nickel transport system permease protein